jgi:hypothetical protein
VQADTGKRAMAPHPVAGLVLVDLYHIFQNPERHQAIGFRLMFDEDIDQDLAAGGHAPGDLEGGDKHQIGFEVSEIPFHKGSRVGSQMLEIDKVDEVHTGQP